MFAHALVFAALSAAVAALGEEFPCASDSAVVPTVFANDGFLDCIDGSDEPSGHLLLGIGNFTCDNGWQTVPAFVYDDTICDCCDGSDEPTIRASCPNVCRGLLERRITQLQDQLTAWDDGLGVASRRKLSRKQRTFVLDGVGAEATRWSVAADSANDEVLEYIATLPNRQPRNNEEYQHIMNLQQAALYTRFQKDRWSLLMGLDYGPANIFLPLVNAPCILSPAWTEKIVKGGSTTVVPKVYAFEVCLFHNITQYEYKEAVWKALEDESKPVKQARVEIGSSGNVASPRHSPQLPHTVPPTQIRRSDLSANTLLGMFLGWESTSGDSGVRSALFEDPNPETGAIWASSHLPSAASDAVTDGFVMRYGYGTKCGDGTELRRVGLRLVCGAKLDVVAVLENGNCKYDVTVTAPEACTRWPRGVLNSDLQKLKGFLDKV